MKKLRTNISLGFLFLLCASITACENKQNDSIFSINDFIEKYNLNETLVFGSLPNDGFEISFISIPFIERNEESNKKKDSNSTIKIADYQFINEDDEVIEGELYGSSLITPSSLDYLIELISTRSTGDFHNEWSVSNEWDSDFKKEYLISLDYDDNRSGYANFEVNGFSYMLSSGEYDYLVIGNGSINPNINGDELRMKKVKFEINHKEKCPSQRSIPGLRTYLDEETEYDFSGGAQGSYGPEATYKGHYTFYKNTPTVDPGMIGFFQAKLWNYLF